MFVQWIATGLKTLLFGAQHGSLESQMTLWLHSNKTECEIWQKQFNTILDMLAKFKRKEYPIFRDDSDEEIAKHTNRMARYLLNLNSEHHVMLAYVAPLYAHDYLQLLHVMQSMGVIEQFSCINSSNIIQNQGYTAFCSFLKTFVNRLAQNINALSPADLADLQSALFLYWNMELMHTDDKVEKKEWLSNKIKDVYLHATALREKIPFTQAMTDFYEYITLEYLADNETIPLAQWNSTLESLVTTSSNKTHVLCGLTMICKRAKDKQKQQHLTLLCNYLGSNAVRGLHHTSALLKRQLYHLFVDMTNRGDLVNLKKILSYVADKEQSPEEHELYEIIELHLSKKRSSEEQRTFKAMIKASGIVLNNYCVAHLVKRIVKL